MAIFQLLRFSTNTYYLLLLVLLCTVHILQGFNLDVRFPVVKEGKTPGSLFGFSVALHKQMVGEKRYLLLVGAPKEKAESGVKANKTGDVYTCPVNVAQSDCTRMNLIGSDPDLIEGEDRVEDMWLGVTVASQRQPGGRILTCGHRFVKIYGVLKLRQMIGKCYIRGNDLNYNETDMHWQNPDQVCSHTKDITGEVMCNMGISAAITDTEVIVGAPGSFEWQGNVHVSWMNPKVIYDTKRSSFPNFNNRRHIYIGYSVAEGRGLLSQDQDTVVTGAPKDNKDDAKGSVILTVKEKSGSGDQLKPYLTLRGEQMGSYFGNSLAVADLNNDGWNDLIVGAPFYFDRKKELGGAVYVYMNENGSFRQSSSIILRGPRDSAFGMAVAAIGDVNQDGFQDFAVGAPFHGTGRVFIWTGSAQGISQEPSQVIEGEDIAGGGFKTFGYSINGGLDVDENRYPDMVVGSLDDRVALLRARPVIHLIKTLEVTPEIVDPKDCDNCVAVEVCFSYTLSTGDKDFRKNVTVKYTVEADLTRHNHRVRFQDNGQDSYTGFLSMPSAKCKTLRLGLVSPIRDKVEPVVFSLNVSLHEGHPKARQSLQNLDAFPVLSEGKASLVKKEIHFQKACGLDNKCQSNLQMKAEFANTNEEQTPFPSHDGHQVLQYSASVKKVLLVVDVTNFQSPGQPAEDAHNAMLNVTIPPSLIYSGVRSKSNSPVIECSAEDLVLLCELGNPFTSNQRAQVLITFETSKINLDTREIRSTLQLSTLSKQSNLQPLPLLMVVEYTLETSFELAQYTGRTHFSGDVMGESGMKTASDVGSHVEFTFKVNVIGKPLGNLGNLEVEFDWPWEVANGKWLLYLMEIQTKGTSDSHCVPPGDIVNPLNLTLPESKARRRRREEGSTEEGHPREPKASINLKGTRKKSFKLDCVTGTAHCVKFICPLHNMNNTATIIVRARVWNSTMLEDYREAWRVTVNGKATLKLVTDKPTIRMNTKSTEFTLDIDPELGEEAPYQVPLWIIIVSAVAGVLLLAFIILLMWKCGFFKRPNHFKMTPTHQGVKIGKEERYQVNEGFLIEEPNPNKKKKHWITNWTEIQHYY
ncbi:integrin alpha-3-like isoform X1 [Coregonus clupeaformis]|uniref:integrin alpha-3-like isoform X1 n=1 Tax=Coregonus clupeaformis TaxID=59861 RepID=UPI001E1C506D|nr:integrin alpha-3-like isoform X1 [Coregonus clupeaformis]